MSVLTKILGGLAGPVVTYLSERQKIRSAERIRKEELKDATHKRQIELLAAGLAADANWEMAFAEQAATSWKDEYTLIVVSIPLILAFIPGCAPVVAAGFASFTATPMWYQVMVQSIFYATYGMRLWRRHQSDT